mmetsp:Transcript_15125/g.41583  ORF Transcript_15125/g.41583 Transcript_15125/m.41583 type:complete len:295 (+) Transcript_15125:343-1227(+)
MESRVRLGTRFEIFEQFWELSGSTRQQGTFLGWQAFPIKTLEPRVLHHLFESVLKLGSILRRTNSRFGAGQQTTQKVNTFGRQVGLGIRWQLQALAPAQNLATSRDGIFRIERGITDQTFKHNDTQGPPVHGRRVRVARSAILSSQYLRCDVVRSTNSRICHLSSSLASRHLRARLISRGSGDTIINRHSHGIPRVTMLACPASAVRVVALRVHSRRFFRDQSLLSHHLQDVFRVIHGANFSDLFAKSQVSQFQMTLGIQKHVIRFDITMNVPQSVHTADGVRGLSHEILGDRF